ncbi:MAG: chemotaxis protein CheW [Mycobacteriales bacterium]
MTPVTLVATEGTRLCTFLVGNLLLGLPVSDVAEVVRGGGVTPVPLAPSAVLGLLNLRGQIVPVVDARRRFGLPPGVEEDEATHIIVRRANELVSLRVDRAADVVTLPEHEREEVPESVNPLIRNLLTSSYQRPRALLLVMDPDLVLLDT